MFWPKCLTYGNWGGPGWSGGEFNHNPEKTKWTVPGIDRMDEAFKLHDWQYQTGRNRKLADIRLIQVLKEIKVSGVWAYCYRVVAIFVFTLKIILASKID